MTQKTDRGQARMSWRQCGLVLCSLQSSLFLDRDYWVLGNLEHRSMRSTHGSRAGDRR